MTGHDAGLSLGTPEIQDVLIQAVNATVLEYNIPIFNAAGNSGSDSCTNSPSRTPYVISVGATDSEDYIASFSNFGRCVDGYVPGVNVKGASYLGDTLYETLSGTSQATPVAAGIGAMLLSADPTLDWADLHDYINLAYSRNSTSEAKIMQSPPLSRIFYQKMGLGALMDMCIGIQAMDDVLDGDAAALAAIPMAAQTPFAPADTSVAHTAVPGFVDISEAEPVAAEEVVATTTTASAPG